MTKTGQRKYWAFATLHTTALIAVFVGAVLQLGVGAYLWVLLAFTFGLSAKSVIAWAGNRWLAPAGVSTEPPVVIGDPWMTTALQGFIRAWEIDTPGQQVLGHLLTIARQRGAMEALSGVPMTMGAIEEMVARGQPSPFITTKAPIIT